MQNQGKRENLNAEVSELKAFILEQLYVIKNFVDDISSETVAPKNLEFIKALKEEIRHLKNENSTKIYIIKMLTEKQAGETTLTPRIHQLDTQTQKEVTPKTRQQVETISKNNKNGSKRQSYQKVYEFVQPCRESIFLLYEKSENKDVDLGTKLINKKIDRTIKGMLHHVKGCLEDTCSYHLIS